MTGVIVGVVDTSDHPSCVCNAVGIASSTAEIDMVLVLY